MRMVFGAFSLLVFVAVSSYADRGPVIWEEGVALSQQSQKAIILHNRAEEVLILGTELKANKEVDVLEFIPFPSEPKVGAATGNPFDEIGKLAGRKGLVFQFADSDIGKGGGEEARTAPVEIRLSEKIGLHDVTVVKINDIEQFSAWLESFFKSKSIPADKEKLARVYNNARDYLGRGYNHFVFDSVRVSEKIKFLEPLVYRFKADRIYYPLKTSNLIGGGGMVEMILILPGSISDELWQTAGKMFVLGPGRNLSLSSSSKIHPQEVKSIYEADTFFGGSRIYIQALKYEGGYDFKDDFTYDLNKLIPYAYRFESSSPFADKRLIPPLTKDEKRDMREAFCPAENQGIGFLLSRSELDCWNFIPNDEYRVFEALFQSRRLSGIPSVNVILENNTIRKEYKGRNIDKSIDTAITKNFNDSNRVEYPLENAFLQSGQLKIGRREDPSADAALSNGKTYVSRAGFNNDKSKAMVYVEHIAGPRAGTGYYVTLEKHEGAWGISGFQISVLY